MVSDELRAELRRIIALETTAEVDWPVVEERCLALVRDFVPLAWDEEIVSHFLDDPDIRRKDWRYAEQQREQLIRYLNAS